MADHDHAPEEAAPEHLVALERDGWDALTRGGDAARAFYDDVLAPDPLMLLPGGLVLQGRETVLESMTGAPWDEYAIEDAVVRPLGADAAVVAYGVTARRGDLRYSALMSSTYVRDVGWRLAVHQQTPR